MIIKVLRLPSMRLLFGRLLLAFTMLDVGPSKAGDALQSVRVTDDFFGLHIRWGAISTPWPFVRFQSWRVITPETEWRGLQPQRSVWKFETLDRAVALSEEHGVEVILTLGQTPTWASARPTEPSANGPGHSAEPKNLEDWEYYVRTVIARYRGKIKYYEVWNEPYYSDLRGYTTKGHFSGSVAEMMKLAKITRKALNDIDPNAKLISPSCTGGDTIGVECIELFLKNGGASLVDVVSFHFYMLPEKIPKVANEIYAVMKKFGVQNLPLWNTESGYLVNGTDKATPPLQNLGDPFDFVLSQEALPGYVLRSMVLSAASGITRYYHYSWDIPTMHLMWKKGVEPTPASFGYAQALRWMRGSTIMGCENRMAGIWSCELLSARNHRGVLIWSVLGTASVAPPEGFDAIAYETLDGKFSPVNSPSQISVGETPILVRSEKALW